MSGRLIILPKKSYCPWNPENVERVLRDEREHAEKIEQEAKKQKAAESRKRLNALKNGGSDEASLQHVNLFQKEEEEENESYKTKRESVDKTFYLGNSIVREKWKNERNEKKPSLDETTAKEERLKATMDPMNEFVSKTDNANTIESIEEQSKQHKRRRKHRHEKKDKRKSKRRRKSHEEDSKDTRDLEMIELRRRRAEREERERKRQARLL